MSAELPFVKPCRFSGFVLFVLVVGETSEERVEVFRRLAFDV